MEQAKYTPGPWIHHPDDNIIATNDGRRMLEWQARSLHVPAAERDANARLVAAAPELLEALILLEAEMVLSGNAESRDYGWKPAIEKTRAAILKATGEKQ
ncbi:hypothetical protein ABIC89_001023 [Variovorax boronicumulans]|uniref:hypothetical protein n=1 Tax=Variovorax boronicumulans TaxID=436515 RepID=UPI00339A2547